MKPVVLGVAFAAELGLLATAAWCGWSLPGSVVLRLVAAVLLPVLVGVVWGLVLAPRARRRWPEPWRTVGKVTLLVLGGVALLAGGHPWLAALLGVVGSAATVVGRGWDLAVAS